ncbi:hypothetical protein FOA52_011310 [Chlamydomonas sp. UWO 241]|nr:hypothetical protein FOA52_011310 [Chlamydomonas sp. UWO 241]
MAPNLATGSGEAAPMQEFDYDVEVDSECKAIKVTLLSVGAPHMRAFHLAWVNFFMTFLATFAPASLIPIIREDLSLTEDQLGSARTATVVGAIFARVAMGVTLDVMGARLGSALIMCMFAAPVFLFALTNDAATFAGMRFLIGMCLTSFVCCQQWVGSMFNVNIVGTANAISAGWGNAGGGATQIIMPAIYQAIRGGGVPAFEAWRWAFMVPGGIFLIMGLLTWSTGWDAPRGDFRVLKENGEIASNKGSALRLVAVALLNYRTWVMMFNYGYCFGVELTVDNIIVTYLYDKYRMNLVTAGGLGALFGLMNVFSRPSGGMLSDLIAVPFGMRGRIWCLFTLQFLGGVFCLVLGLVHTLGATIAVMIIFSIFCQQACGATFGIVPFVSRRAYGVVTGMVSAGGNIGSVITTLIFFGGAPTSPTFAQDDDFIYMGVMIMCATLTLSLLHFPMWGSMFVAGDDSSEEDYYLNEWSAHEIAMGLHSTSMKFAVESRSQRCPTLSLDVSTRFADFALDVSTRLKRGSRNPSSHRENGSSHYPGNGSHHNPGNGGSSHYPGNGSHHNPAGGGSSHYPGNVSHHNPGNGSHHNPAGGGSSHYPSNGSHHNPTSGGSHHFPGSVHYPVAALTVDEAAIFDGLDGLDGLDGVDGVDGGGDRSNR